MSASPRREPPAEDATRARSSRPPAEDAAPVRLPVAGLPDDAFPEHPYPGAWPAVSFAHDAATSWPLLPSPWRFDPGPGDRRGGSLDTWLAARDAAPLRAREAVLAYGSNRCPSKLTWLRRVHGLRGPVVVLRARCDGLAAVWAWGTRVRDGARPATLAAAPGVREDHAVLLVTPAQRLALDACEGRGARYDLARVRTGTVTLDDGSVPTAVLAYVARADVRGPLRTATGLVRCADVPHAAALALRGDPAPHGLAVDVVDPNGP